MSGEDRCCLMFHQPAEPAPPRPLLPFRFLVSVHIGHTGTLDETDVLNSVSLIQRLFITMDQQRPTAIIDRTTRWKQQP